MVFIHCSIAGITILNQEIPEKKLNGGEIGPIQVCQTRKDHHLVALEAPLLQPFACLVEEPFS